MLFPIPTDAPVFTEGSGLINRSVSVGQDVTMTTNAFTITGLYTCRADNDVGVRELTLLLL